MKIDINLKSSLMKIELDTQSSLMKIDINTYNALGDMKSWNARLPRDC